MKRAKQTAGFSLYELLMTMSIAATVLGLGIPAFGDMRAETRLRVEANALFHALHLAKKESITRQRAVTICASSNGVSCNAGRDWSSGWIMFAKEAGGRELERRNEECERALATQALDADPFDVDPGIRYHARFDAAVRTEPDDLLVVRLE